MGFRSGCLKVGSALSAAKELLNTPCSSERGPDLHYGGAEGADRLFFGFVPVRGLLQSAKHLIVAAKKQLFLAAKHAVAVHVPAQGALSAGTVG